MLLGSSGSHKRNHGAPGRSSHRLAVAIVEQDPPLLPLNLSAERFAGRPASQAGFATVGNVEGLAGRRGCEELRRWMQLGSRSKFSRGGADRVEDRMVADAAEPVFGVGEVRLSAVHQAVPVAAGGGVDRLADLMRLVEKV